MILVQKWLYVGIKKSMAWGFVRQMRNLSVI